jgi:predicted lipoprotein with Yx(FWY)xxD motif
MGKTAGLAALLVLAACGSSGRVSAPSATAHSAGATDTATSVPPGAAFTAAGVPGLGTVVVDERGYTVYVLTSADHQNVPCDDASGCTKVWPDLPLPDGASTARAGSGMQASRLGTLKLSDGRTYPTYGGWLMYEFTGDTGPAEGHGEGISSFGGTWLALNPAGNPVASPTGSTLPPTTTAAPTTTALHAGQAPASVVAPTTTHPPTTAATTSPPTTSPPTTSPPTTSPPTTAPPPPTTGVTTPCRYPPCY